MRFPKILDLETKENIFQPRWCATTHDYFQEKICLP
jgi:hypothetical protein